MECFSNVLRMNAVNVFSQHGEDGIILMILNRISARNNWIVEFGAWDGMHLSNSRNLIENHKFSAILIEGDKEKFVNLEKKYSSNPLVHTVNTFVGFEEWDGLDSILSSYDIPFKFDLLSIDIDGNDYHIWSSIKKYTPKVVCIEFNQTIPNGIDFVQKADKECNQGSSLSSLVKLAKSRGYELVFVNACNAFFVLAEYYTALGILDNSIEVLRDDSASVTYLFSGYDGKVYLSGMANLPWHHMVIKQRSIQVLPKYLRKIPYRYNFLQKVLYFLYLLINNPNFLISKISPSRNKCIDDKISGSTGSHL